MINNDFNDSIEKINNNHEILSISYNNFDNNDSQSMNFIFNMNNDNDNDNYNDESQLNYLESQNIFDNSLNKVDNLNNILIEEKKVINRTQTTGTKTKIHLFEVSDGSPEKKFRGRKREKSNPRKRHDKYTKDNILDKIKSHIYYNILEFINGLIKDKYGELKILYSAELKTENKKKKVDFLNLSIRQLLSKNISPKYKKLRDYPLHNKIIIDSIYQNNEIELIKVLETTFNQMTKIYCQNEINNDIFKDFKRIDNDIKQFEKDKLDKIYIDKYINKAQNYESIIKGIDDKKIESNKY